MPEVKGLAWRDLTPIIEANTSITCLKVQTSVKRSIPTLSDNQITLFCRKYNQLEELHLCGFKFDLSGAQRFFTLLSLLSEFKFRIKENNDWKKFVEAAENGGNWQVVEYGKKLATVHNKLNFKLKKFQNKNEI